MGSSRRKTIANDRDILGCRVIYSMVALRLEAFPHEWQFRCSRGGYIAYGSGIPDVCRIHLLCAPESAARFQHLQPFRYSVLLFHRILFPGRRYVWSAGCIQLSRSRQILVADLFQRSSQRVSSILLPLLFRGSDFILFVWRYSRRKA